ncbi:MAG: hypothetical protein IPG39_20725 [Bacteroidetes bacterium]|nr:hypothetical protein [Bacteroidota bacterium]
MLPDTHLGFDSIQYQTNDFVVLQGAVNLSPELINETGEAAFRIPKDEFTNVLLHRRETNLCSFITCSGATCKNNFHLNKPVLW